MRSRSRTTKVAAAVWREDEVVNALGGLSTAAVKSFVSQG